ncbi:MAG: hypothetical protein AAFR81_10540 [Chloroflexota bacterium]
MPIEVQHLEPYIYQATWQGNITLEAIADSLDEVRALADTQQYGSYTIITDMTEAKKFPLSISGLTDIARSDERITAYVFIKGDKTAQFIGKMLDKLSHRHFVFVDTPQEALKQARKEQNSVSVR